MNEGRSLQVVARDARKMAEEKRDYIAPASRLRITADMPEVSDGTFAPMMMLDLPGQPTGYRMTEICQRQVAGNLGLPLEYWRRMLNEAPGLFDETCAVWLEREKSSHLIRTLPNIARAYLSERYRIVDNYDILERAMDVAVETAPDLQYNSGEVDENRLYLKLTTPRRTITILGEPTQVGLLVRNSEVGDGAVAVAPFSINLICTNGMTHTNLGLRQMHLRKALEYSGDDAGNSIWSIDTVNLDNAAFMSKLTDSIRYALSDEILQDLQRQYEGAVLDEVVKPTEIIEVTQKAFALRDGESESMAHHFIMGGKCNRYGLAQALAATAGEVPEYDRATELETFAGRIMAEPLSRLENAGRN